jgi:hypothetical protein
MSSTLSLTERAFPQQLVNAPSIDPALRRAKNDEPFPSGRPSLCRRAARATGRFLIVWGLGVVGTLAWQSYGGAARKMIANSYPQLGWLAPQATPATQSRFDFLATAAVPAASADPDQLKAMSLGLALMRQSVDQIAAGQEQMTREIAKVQEAEQDILDKLSAPPPRPTEAQTRKPVPPTAR